MALGTAAASPSKVGCEPPIVSTGAVVSREPSEHWELVTISVPAELERYLVAKGAITVDGISLTVVDVTDGTFTVSLIPETLARTTLGFKQPGDVVNLEADVLAKYAEKLLGLRSSDGDEG